MTTPLPGSRAIAGVGLGGGVTCSVTDEGAGVRLFRLGSLVLSEREARAVSIAVGLLDGDALCGLVDEANEAHEEDA